jgi:2-dehydro-3-deoxyphosphogluconate aldolase / (4S)-4-hydroxy-2-oxoglutarate aldolase
MRAFSPTLFDRLPVVGILRGLPEPSLRPVVDAVLRGGLTNLEITMNSPGAAAQIRAACQIAGTELNIGAGTVTNVRLLAEARAAGASFIVTPAVASAVIARCVEEQIPVFPGAFSATEIQRAWDLGATMVKVFPAEALGPGRFAELKESLPLVRIMPTGGVDVANLAAYARAGADAYGVGTPLFRPDRIAAGDYEWLREQCQAFHQAYRLALLPQAHEPAPVHVSPSRSL